MNFKFTIRKAVGMKGSKVVYDSGTYHVAYERDALEAYAKDFPQYASEALSIPRSKDIKVVDEFVKSWIIDTVTTRVLPRFDKGMLTLRGLHYQLVSLGMTNTMQHYKRVVSAMTVARWDHKVSFDTFTDEDRDMIGETDYEVTDVDNSIDSAKSNIELFMDAYYKNRWENQPNYVEVIIEKKALLAVFRKPCDRAQVTLGACKGYPSLTFLHDMSLRMTEATRQGLTPVILYFGDYDPSGEDIPRSIAENLEDMGVDVDVRRVLLKEEQVVEMNLPPAPTKIGDSRTANWNGLGQVELDAVDPTVIVEHLEQALNDAFDEDTHDELLEVEATERKYYREELKKFVGTL